MNQTVLPCTVTGHSVTNPSLVSLGYHEKYLAFTVSPNLLAVTECGGKLDCLITDSSAVFCPVEDFTTEVISVVRVHDEKDLLCVGTTEHGVYVTSVTSPVLSSESRLPLQFTGEQIFSACFLSVAASLLSGAKGSTLHSKSEDLLVLSSAFLKHHDASPHRLSLWHVRERCLLWRGPMEPMRAVCTFPRTPSFAGCFHGALSLFTVRRADAGGSDAAGGGPSALPRDSHPGRKGSGVTLLNRVCDTVEVLKGVEYVHCAASHDAKKCSFLALTATGFLVAFDRFTGAIIRWMDCKISPARSVSFAGKGNYILLSGALARFFLSSNWGFCGRIKVEGTAAGGPFPEVHFTAGVSIGSCAVLFSSNGGHSIQHFVQSSTATTTANGGAIGANVAPPVTGEMATGGDSQQGQKLRFHQRSFCCPVETGEVEGEHLVQWIRPSPSPSPHGTWCLWTRRYLRLYSPKMFLRKQVVVNSSCAVYHAASRVLLTYELDNAELVAYAGADEWRVATSLRQAEPLSSLCACDSTDVFAGYCLDNHSVYAFSSSWKSPTNNVCTTLDLVPLWVRRFDVTNCPLNRIFFLGNQLYGSTANTLVELEGGRLYAFDQSILSFCVAGTGVLILHTDSCVYYVPDRGFLKSLNFFPSSSPVYVTYERTLDLVAIADSHRAYIMRLGDASPFWEVKHCFGSHPSGARVIGAITLRADPIHLVLSILDAHGNFAEYALRIDQLTHGPRSQTLSTASRFPRSGRLLDTKNSKNLAADSSRGSRVRALSEGTPTNRELRDRFDALSGFFAEHKKQRVASNRARSQTLSAGTPSSTPRQLRNDDPPVPPSDVGIADETVVESPQTGPDAPIPESGLPEAGQKKPLFNLQSRRSPDVGSLLARPAAPSKDVTMKTTPRLSNQNASESAVSMSAIVDVSALTLPSDSYEMEGNATFVRGLEQAGLADARPQRSPSIPSRNTVDAQANFDAANLNAIAPAEDVVNNSFTDFTNPYSRPARFDAGAQLPPNYQRTPSCTLSLSSTARLSEHTRQLRESLQHLKDLLDQPDLRIDAEDDVELSRLPSLLSAVAITLQSCRDRRSNDTSASSSLYITDNALLKDYSQVLLTQMQLIQQQNRHLEEQNQIILEKLLGKNGK
ncbi:unnamed protein product [Phytomonas sp. EM1]|nr:unnamed protein product [Phytomonas sp. EM1]|eukprot:CCW61803.1 unnamed protein product [Phytomonas sp. isolate EM1]